MKFSIRDLLLVTVIVALALGWWVDRRRVAAKRDKWERHAEMLEASRNELQDEIARLKLPNSSAPAPNPPKE